MERPYEDFDEEAADAVCEHGVGFYEDCEWCEYEEDGPMDLEDQLDNALDRSTQNRGA